MRIQLDPRTFRVLKVGFLLLAIVALGYAAYASTNQTASNTGKITPGQKNFALATPACRTGGINSGGATPLCEFSSQPICNGATGNYDTLIQAYTITTWVVAQQGGGQTKYVCLENTGIPSIASVSWTADPTTPMGLTCNSTVSGKNIGSGGFLAIDLTCNTTLTTDSGPGLDFGVFTIN